MTRLGILTMASGFVALALSVAHAEPKTIILENCSKVLTETVQLGGQKSITVTCTGETLDPRVRDSKAALFTTGSSRTEWNKPEPYCRNVGDGRPHGENESLCQCGTGRILICDTPKPE